MSIKYLGKLLTVAHIYINTYTYMYTYTYSSFALILGIPQIIKMLQLQDIRVKKRRRRLYRDDAAESYRANAQAPSSGFLLWFAGVFSLGLMVGLTF